MTLDARFFELRSPLHADMGMKAVQCSGMKIATWLCAVPGRMPSMAHSSSGRHVHPTVQHVDLGTSAPLQATNTSINGWHPATSCHRHTEAACVYSKTGRWLRQGGMESLITCGTLAWGPREGPSTAHLDGGGGGELHEVRPS